MCFDHLHFMRILDLPPGFAVTLFVEGVYVPQPVIFDVERPADNTHTCVNLKLCM